MILGIANDIDLPHNKLVFCNLGLIVAKRDIARRWGVAEPPSLENWRLGMDMYMASERVIFKSRRCPRKFFKIWGDWLRFYDLEQILLE